MERNIRLEQRCLEIATAAHATINQVRKYTGETYIIHPIAVAETVRSVGGDSIQISAAYLHDTLEDTELTYDQLFKMIDNEFGNDIAVHLLKMVSGLTDISTLKDGTRKLRKAIDRAHTAEQCNRTKTVKLADLIDNWKSIVVYDANFAKVFASEKQALLDEALVGGDQELFNKASQLLVDYRSI